MTVTNTIHRATCDPKSMVILKWTYDECTHRSVTAIDRLMKQASGKRAVRVVLDMSQCNYVSISGMRGLLEWAGNLSDNGKQLRISGLSKLQSCIFTLSGLDWMLMD